MADTDVWALGSISSPAATDRVPIATGSGAGGYSERSEFIWLSDGYYWADGKMRVGGPAGVGFINFSSTAVNDIGAVGCGVTTGYGDSVGIAVQNATGVLTLATNSTERLRIGASGNVGIGTTAPIGHVDVEHSGGGTSSLILSNTSWYRSLQFLAISAGYRINAQGWTDASSRELRLATGGVDRVTIDVSGNVTPGADNAQAFGWSSARWTVIYAATGTINTSDERYKLWIGRATEDRATKDRRIARAILDELGWYQFTDAVTEKGPDGARWHFGARAQRIWQIVADEGLAPPLVDVDGTLLPDITWTGPVAPAWLCFDGWNEQIEVSEDGDATVVREAGHLFGFRVDEMNLLLSWALHDRLSALEEITAA